MKASGKVHLIAVGNVPAIKASDLQVGMRQMYNYGSTATVMRIDPKGEKSLSVIIRVDESGKLYTKTKRKDSLVPVITDANGDVLITEV
jgi:hypothetical protein